MPPAPALANPLHKGFGNHAEEGVMNRKPIYKHKPKDKRILVDTKSPSGAPAHTLRTEPYEPPTSGPQVPSEPPPPPPG